MACQIYFGMATSKRALGDVLMGIIFPILWIISFTPHAAHVRYNVGAN